MSSTSAQPIGACALLLNPQGQVLVGKRKNSYKAGFYGVPGGRIELNEPITTAITREIAEETGITGVSLEYLGVVRENQASYDFIHFIFIARAVTQTPQLCEPDKCEGWEWIDPTSSDYALLPGHQAAIELLIQHKSLIDLTTPPE